MIQYSETEFLKQIGRYDTAIFAYMEEVGASKGNRSIIGELFNRQKVDEQSVAITGTTGHSDLKPHNGTRNYEDVQEWYTKRVEFHEFSQTESFGRTYLDDNKLMSVDVKNRGASMMNAAYRTQENFAAAIFTNADQSSFTKDGKSYNWTLAADSVAVASASHTSITGRCGTLDNTDTNALDGDNLEAGIIAMGAYQDDNGNQGTYFANTLVVGLENRKTALELINSDGKPKVNNNEYNIYEGDMRLIVWNRFKAQSGKSAYPWTLMDIEAAKENLFFFDRINPEITDYRNWQTMSWDIGVYCRFTIMIYDWRWSYWGIPA
jgi:hypothetical protein